MAQYFTDFSNESIGSLPTDWVEAWDSVSDWSVQSSAEAANGLALRPAGDSSDREFVYWDTVGASTDMETLIKGNALTSSTGNANHLRAMVRAQTGERGYFAEFDTAGTYRIRKYDSAGSTVTLNSTAFAWTRGDVLWNRIRVEGDTVMGKAWHDGNPEPETWMVSATDTEYAGGWAGVGVFSSNHAGDFHHVGVATDGDTAPSAPVDVEPGNRIHYWELNEGTGSVALDSAGNADGTIVGADWVQLPSGEFGLDFEETENDYVDTGYYPAEADLAGGGALEMWVYWKDMGASRQYVGSWGAPRFYLGITETGRQAGYGSTYGTGGTLPEEGWQHYVMTNDGTTTTVYQDGVNVGTFASTFSGTQTNPFYIGNVSGTGYAFDNVIGELAIHDVHLTQEDVQALYDEGLPSYGENAVDGNITGVVMDDGQAVTDATVYIVNSAQDQVVAEVDTIFGGQFSYKALTGGPFHVAVQEQQGEGDQQVLRNAESYPQIDPPGLLNDPVGNPVHWYPMAEGVGLTTDDPVGDTTAELSTGVSWVSDPSFVGEAAVDVDGADGTRIYAPYEPSFNGFSEMTFLLTVQPDNVVNRQFLGGSYSSTGDQRSWFFEILDADRLQVFLSGDGAAYEAWPYTNPMSVASTYRVGFRWQSGSVPEVYVNGVQYTTSDTSVPPSSLHTPNLPLDIASSIYTSTRVFDGKVDNVCLYDTYLSDQQIAQDYDIQPWSP